LELQISVAKAKKPLLFFAVVEEVAELRVVLVGPLPVYKIR
jgi:hypothetical protein